MTCSCLSVLLAALMRYALFAVSNECAWAAAPLYGASGGKYSFGSSLYTIDLDSGNVQEVGPITYNNGTPPLILNAMAFDRTSNTLYGHTRVQSNNEKSLFQINVTSGQANLVGKIDGVDSHEYMAFIDTLAFDSMGQLYGWMNDEFDLYSVDKTTAKVTRVGDSGLPSTYGDGLSFDNGDHLYLLEALGTEVYTINTTDGVATFLTKLAPPFFGSNGDVQPETSLFYQLDLQPGEGIHKIAALNLTNFEPGLKIDLQVDSGVWLALLAFWANEDS